MHEEWWTSSVFCDKQIKTRCNFLPSQSRNPFKVVKMEMPSIVESGEDMQLYTPLVGDQMDSTLWKMYLAM